MGSWLVYDKPGFTGNSTVLEMEGRVTPILQNSPVPCVNSLQPLKRVYDTHAHICHVGQCVFFIVCFSSFTDTGWIKGCETSRPKGDTKPTAHRSLKLFSDQWMWFTLCLCCRWYCMKSRSSRDITKNCWITQAVWWPQMHRSAASLQYVFWVECESYVFTYY